MSIGAYPGIRTLTVCRLKTLPLPIGLGKREGRHLTKPLSPGCSQSLHLANAVPCRLVLTVGLEPTLKRFLVVRLCQLGYVSKRGSVGTRTQIEPVKSRSC